MYVYLELNKFSINEAFLRISCSVLVDRQRESKGTASSILPRVAQLSVLQIYESLHPRQVYYFLSAVSTVVLWLVAAILGHCVTGYDLTGKRFERRPLRCGQQSASTEFHASIGDYFGAMGQTTGSGNGLP